MNFENKLISGLFIKRYKRFFSDISINNKIVTAHCPNTGSMQGLLNKGNKVWLSKSNNPNRKLKYTLEIIENNKIKVKLICKKGPANKFAKPKKVPRKIGKPIIANGIKNLKFSSNVSE